MAGDRDADVEAAVDIGERRARLPWTWPCELGRSPLRSASAWISGSALASASRAGPWTGYGRRCADRRSSTNCRRHGRRNGRRAEHRRRGWRSARWRRCHRTSSPSTPTGPSGSWRGMRLSMTLTTPPIADDPNSKAAGPRSTSMRSAVIGLMATAWSGPDDDRSRLPMPSVRMRTRSPDRPRSTGAEAVGPKLVALTPGWRASVSPMLGRTSRVSSAWSSTETPPSTSDSLRRTPVTTTCSSSSVMRLGGAARLGFGRRRRWLRRHRHPPLRSCARAGAAAEGGGESDKRNRGAKHAGGSNWKANSGSRVPSVD